MPRTKARRPAGTRTDVSPQPAVQGFTAAPQHPPAPLPVPRRGARTVLLLAATLVVTVVMLPTGLGAARPLAASAASAGATGSPESAAPTVRTVSRVSRVSTVNPATRFVRLINQARARHGLARLDRNRRLAAVAQDRADIMARQQRLSHTADLGRRVCCSRWQGENSGYGSTPRQVHWMFMHSPAHARNILKRGADGVGVGVSYAGGWLWVTEVFRDRR